MTTGTRALNAGIAMEQPATLLPAVIGFFFSFRIFAVLLAVRILQADSEVGVIVSLAINFLLLGMVMLNHIGPTPRKLGFLLRLPCFGWVMLFLGFTGCSLMWTVAASLPSAIVFWCAMAADSAMVILLLRNGPILDTAAGIMKGFVYGACCIALVAWIMPAQSDLRLGDEELLGPNAIGFACAFAIFLAEYLILVHRKRAPSKWIVFFLSITLMRSLSKTSIIATLAGQAVLLLQVKSISRKTKIKLVLGAVLVIVAFSGLLASYYTVYSNAGDQAETLSGRLGIWAYILSEAVDKPWIGHGFHSVWKVIPPFYEDQFEARHAHNELLQQFYAYGVVGIVMLVGLYGSFYRRARKLPPSPLKAIMYSILVFVLVRGVADTEVFDLSLPIWAIAMFSAIVMEYDARPLADRREANVDITSGRSASALPFVLSETKVPDA
jgi:exopolysaccharide production protein ExoQ